MLNAKGYDDADPLPRVVAFSLGVATNAVLAKYKKTRKVINYGLGGIYLVAPSIDVIGFLLEQTIYRKQYKNAHYEYWNMFPELFLYYCGGACLGAALTEEVPKDTHKETDKTS